MSHNISCKMNCSLEDVMNPMVKQILEKDFKWKILPKGVYKGFYGSEKAVEHDIRIALPADQATAYGEEVSAEEAKQYNVPLGYKIIAIKGNPGGIVKKRNDRGMMEDVEEPGSITVTMDQGSNYGGKGVKPEDIQKKIESAVEGAQVIYNTMDIIAELRGEGNQMAVTEDQVRAQIAAAIIGNKPMSVDLY